MVLAKKCKSLFKFYYFQISQLCTKPMTKMIKIRHIGTMIVGRREEGKGRGMKGGMKREEGEVLGSVSRD